MSEYPNNYGLQLTLEKHFANLALLREDFHDLYDLWKLFKKDITDKLINSRSVFSHFSLHDSSHSRTVISCIEMFLGEERIKCLSISETFMLLSCAYAHDYGMALSVDKVYQELGSKQFMDFIQQEHENPNSDYSDEVEILYNLMFHLDKDSTLQSIYQSLIVVVENYLRPTHWIGVENLSTDFDSLFGGRLKIRLVNSIIQICQSHCYEVESLLKLERYEQGVVSDIYHPRFVAAMLRLGDLLDLDNSRFPKWFREAVLRRDPTIPELSRFHYQKHESISHFYIGPKKIQVVSICHGENAEDIARLVDSWLFILQSECNFMNMRWADLTPPNFGRPPFLEKREIYIKDIKTGNLQLYQALNHHLQMKVSQETVMKLLEGTNIYNDRYVGIREIVQNAVDASLLQMWHDLMSNKYAYLLKKDNISKNMGMLDIPQEIYRFYDITVELIKDYYDKEIYVIIKDKGLGIANEDLEYMANVGESKEKNQRVKNIISSMPKWLRPAGVFGIGLQSVFQITDRIDFYSRRPNQLEKHITFYSVGKNQGRIEMREVSDNEIFYDNSSQGTNIKFAVNREKLWEYKEKFLYYDPQFDEGDLFEATFAEMSHVIEAKLRENPIDYFNIFFNTLENKDGACIVTNEKRIVHSFFKPQYELEKATSSRYGLSILPMRIELSKYAVPLFLVDNKCIYYYDIERSLFYRFIIFPCSKKPGFNGNIYSLPRSEEQQIRMWYKFTELSDISALYNGLEHTQQDILCASILHLDIIIFDTPANKYLNIDRNHLKKEQDILTNETLENVQYFAFSKLCTTILQKPSSKKYKYFLTNPELAVSLLLLFYRYIDHDSFLAFLNLFRKETAAANLALSVDDIFIQNLRFSIKNMVDKKSVLKTKFKVTFPMPVPEKEKLFTSATEQEPSDDEELEFQSLPVNKENEIPQKKYINLLRIEDLKQLVFNKSLCGYFPPNYFEIKTIQTMEANGNIYLCYDLCVRSNIPTCKQSGVTSASPFGIKLDTGARLIDYSRCFGLQADYPIIDYFSIMKKLFKPDSHYPNLIVSRKPRSFKFGDNFLNHAERGINFFILSPFDDKSLWMMQEMVKKDSFKPEDIFESLQASSHFNKCLSYVEKFHYSLLPGMEQASPITSEKIKIDYKRFIINFCSLLKEYAWWFEMEACWRNKK